MDIRQIELPAMTDQGADDLWRIHVDLDDSYPTADGSRAWHACSGVSQQVAEQALSAYRQQRGDGITFIEGGGSPRQWHYPWTRVENLRIMPMREAL